MTEPNWNAAALDAAQAWWRTLAEHPGDRAALRRAQAVDDVYFVPAFHALLRALRDDEARVAADAVACAAAVLARITDDVDGASLGEVFGQGERPPLSHARFKRLLAVQARDYEALLPALRRALDVLDGRAPVRSLARAALWWTPSARKHLAMDFYRAAPTQQTSKG